MKLRAIKRHEDKTNEAYNSSECQQLLEAYDDFYTKIGFNLPWVGYFVIREERIVGSWWERRRSLLRAEVRIITVMFSKIRKSIIEPYN